MSFNSSPPPLELVCPASILIVEQNKPIERELENVREVVKDSSKVVVLTGAGISTDSGIPDFRGPMEFGQRIQKQRRPQILGITRLQLKSERETGRLELLGIFGRLLLQMMDTKL